MVKVSFTLFWLIQEPYKGTKTREPNAIAKEIHKESELIALISSFEQMPVCTVTTWQRQKDVRVVFPNPRFPN